MAAVADVLVVTGTAVRRSCGELLARYPGLALVLVVDDRDLVTGWTRDGPLIPVDSADAPVGAIADALYRWWVSGADSALLRRGGPPADQSTGSADRNA